jgi:hypothetical protein
MGRTWDAVIDLFAARTIPIRTIERASGIIVTEQLSVGPEGLTWADCGKEKSVNGTVHLRPNYGTYNVLVREDSTHSSVKVTVRWVYSYLGRTMESSVTECSTKHVFERVLEADAKARAEAPGLAKQVRKDRNIPTASSLERATDGQTPSPPSTAPSADGATSNRAPSDTATAGARPLSGARPNGRLLGEPDFARAIGDLQTLRFLDGFQEVGTDSLMVEVSDKALATNLSEYNLGRLFLAYSRITNWSPVTTVVLSHREQTLGTVTRNGLLLRESQ